MTIEHELTIWPDAPRKGRSEPVQRDHTQDRIQWNVIRVGPLELFLSNPSQESEWARGQDQTYGRGTCRMFQGIGCAILSPMFGIVQLLLLLGTDSLSVALVDPFWRGQEIDCIDCIGMS